MTNRIKQYWPVLAILIAALTICIYQVFKPQTEPQGLLADIPPCQDMAEVSLDVLLVHLAEVHPKRPGSLPSGYEAAIKQLYRIDTTFAISLKETDHSIIQRVESPYPSEFLIGKRLNYTITRKPCKDPKQPDIKDPEDTPDPKQEAPVKPRPVQR